MSRRATFAQELADWNTSEPLGWKVDTPGVPGQLFLTALPELSHLIEKLRPSLENDFAFFARLSELDVKVRGTSEHERYHLAALEARHYLAIAFSTYVVQAVRPLPLGEWRWTQWLRNHRHEITALVSFNYDSVLLRAARTAEVVMADVAFPHGFIGFDRPNPCARTGYPLQYHAGHNAYMGVLPQSLSGDQLLHPRYEPEIVLPHGQDLLIGTPYGEMMHFFKLAARSFTHCVFMGLSYMEQDRREINNIVSFLGERTTVIVANPSPSAEFLKLIDNGIRDVVCWTNGPETDPI